MYAGNVTILGVTRDYGQSTRLFLGKSNLSFIHSFFVSFVHLAHFHWCFTLQFLGFYSFIHFQFFVSAHFCLFLLILVHFSYHSVEFCVFVSLMFFVLLWTLSRTRCKATAFGDGSAGSGWESHRCSGERARGHGKAAGAGQGKGDGFSTGISFSRECGSWVIDASTVDD